MKVGGFVVLNRKGWCEGGSLGLLLVGNWGAGRGGWGSGQWVGLDGGGWFGITMCGGNEVRRGEGGVRRLR